MCTLPARRSQDYVESPIWLQVLANTVPQCLDPVTVSKLPHSQGGPVNLRVLQGASIHDANAVDEHRHIMVQLGICERHYVKPCSSRVKPVPRCVHLIDETWNDTIQVQARLVQDRHKVDDAVRGLVTALSAIQCTSLKVNSSPGLGTSGTYNFLLE